MYPYVSYTLVWFPGSRASQVDGLGRSLIANNINEVPEKCIRWGIRKHDQQLLIFSATQWQKAGAILRKKSGNRMQQVDINTFLMPKPKLRIKQNYRNNMKQSDTLRSSSALINKSAPRFSQSGE